MALPRKRLPVLVSCTSFDDGLLDQQKQRRSWSSSDDGGSGAPPGRERCAGGRALALACLAAAALLMVACGVIVSQDRAHAAAQQRLNATLRAEASKHVAYAAQLESDVRQLEDQLARARSDAEDAGACAAVRADLNASLAAAKGEAAALAARAKEVEDAKQQLAAEAGELREKLAAAQAEAAGAAAAAEAERGKHAALEAHAAAQGLAQHIPAELAADASDKLGAALLEAAVDGNILMTVCDRLSAEEPQDFVTPWIRQVQRVGIKNAIVLTPDPLVPWKARNLGMAAAHIDSKLSHAAAPSARRAAAKWAAIQRALALGLRVLYADTDVALLRDPFSSVKGDADLEALSSAAEPGGVVISSGGRAGNSSAVAPLQLAPLSPALLFLRPTPAAVDLATAMAAAAANASSNEAVALTLAALAPLRGSAGGEGPTGAALRATLLPHAAFLSAAALLRAPRPAERLREGAGVAAVHAGAAGDGAAAALQRLQALSDYTRGKPAALEALARAARSAAAGGTAAAVAAHRRAHPPRKLWSKWQHGAVLAA